MSLTSGPLAIVELGAIIVGLAVLARLAGRFGFPTAPLYLLAGLSLGEGGILPLVTTRGFVEFGAEIGVILLLFMLGLEYSARDLVSSVRSSPYAGAIDLGLNFLPGVAAGFLLGWSPLAAGLLGGVTYVSSSGIIAKLVSDLRMQRDAESSVVVSLLLIEDLAAAALLPVAGALILGGTDLTGLGLAGLATLGVVGLLFLALHMDAGISRAIFSHSDEALLLSLLGLALLAAGAAEAVNVSGAVGALLAGILLSGPAAKGARVLLTPLRDLFAAIFFFFIGLSVDPATIPPVLVPAALLALVGVASKVGTGWWSAALAGLASRARARAGSLLIPRGELSIAIAGLGSAQGIEPQLAPITVTYVLLLAVVGPLFLKAASRPRG